MSYRIGLSTASVFPESCARAFEYAARLGYECVEVMVGIDSVSMEPEAIAELSHHHQLPISAVHAPCLIFQRRVWGTEPWAKLERSAAMAQRVGAEVVVVHPPFRWQKDYAATFVAGIAKLEASSGIAFAVENMYPWKASGRKRMDRGMEMYLPGWDPSLADYAHATIDLSHAASSRSDPVAMAQRLGSRLKHIHLADGTHTAKDQHWVPGRGKAGAERFLEHLVESNFTGDVIVEISTRRHDSAATREADLIESLRVAQAPLGRHP
jgi:sugar phosphate isomerase/epimerase